MKNYNYHKNKIRTNEPKIWKNNINTEAQPEVHDKLRTVEIY